jgi:hypothetical protein
MKLFCFTATILALFWGYQNCKKKFSSMVYLMIVLVFRPHSTECQDDWRTIKDLEVSNCDLTEVLSQHFPEEAEENYEKLQSGYPVSWPRFKPSTSQIEAYSITTAPTRSVRIVKKFRNTVFKHPLPLIYLDTQYNSTKNTTTPVTPSSHDTVWAADGHLQASKLCQNCSTVHSFTSHVSAIFKI